MAFLTLNGTVVEVQHSNSNEAVAQEIGEATRAFDGTYLTGLRAHKRTWTFDSIPLTESQLAALRTLVGLDAVLTASGDFVNGASVSVAVRLGPVPYIPQGLTPLRVPTLTIIER